MCSQRYDKKSIYPTLLYVRQGNCIKTPAHVRGNRIASLSEPLRISVSEYQHYLVCRGIRNASPSYPFVETYS